MDTSNETQDKSTQGLPANGPGGDMMAQGSLEGTVSADGDPAETGNRIGLGTATLDGGDGAAQGADGEPQQAAPAQQSQPTQQSQSMEQSGQSQPTEQSGQPMAQTQQAGQSQQSSQSPAERKHTGVLRPPVDVIEDAQGITLIADMPGVAKENLNLRLESQSLTIEGALSLDGPQDMESRYAEIRHQHYERTFALSRELDGEKATAELANGVLRIRIPKTAHATPRRIPVNVGSA
ncbi:MAG: heat-shock protein [Massilia sp.]|jgi:HSP20 family protein|nr:heat-shock protein [Massilia sp.]